MVSLSIVFRLYLILENCEAGVGRNYRTSPTVKYLTIAQPTCSPKPCPPPSYPPYSPSPSGNPASGRYGVCEHAPVHPKVHQRCSTHLLPHYYQPTIPLYKAIFAVVRCAEIRDYEPAKHIRNPLLYPTELRAQPPPRGLGPLKKRVMGIEPT